MLDNQYRLEVLGLPDDLPPVAAATFRGRLTRGTRELFDETGLDEISLVVRREGARPQPREHALDLDQRMSYFQVVRPGHDFGRLVLPPDTLEELHRAVDAVRLRHLVFDTWGLRAVEPHPRTAIGLHGPPGTGKTMIAHALATHLGKPLLPARTSQLESKYHGEGGKYLTALFEAARRADAVLFVDEAESLLSRRFESLGQGAEHAVNTLRSELVQHLDRHEGVAVFATNLVRSYDPAISSRLHHVLIPPPDRAAREAIWVAHLSTGLPLADDVSPAALAETGDVVGRDIKRAVIGAAVAVARRGDGIVRHADLADALARLLAQRPAVGDEVTEDERAAIAEGLRARGNGG